MLGTSILCTVVPWLQSILGVSPVKMSSHWSSEKWPRLEIKFFAGSQLRILVNELCKQKMKIAFLPQVCLIIFWTALAWREPWCPLHHGARFDSCSKALRIRASVIWQYPERKGKHLKLFLLLQVFWLHRENARVGQVLSGALQGPFFFFFLHGLISVFLLLGRRIKHEKLVFTILDHPVQHKALFKNVQFTSPTGLWMPHSSGPNHLVLNIFKWHFTCLSYKNTTLIYHGIMA